LNQHLRTEENKNIFTFT